MDTFKNNRDFCGCYTSKDLQQKTLYNFESTNNFIIGKIYNFDLCIFPDKTTLIAGKIIKKTKHTITINYNYI